MGKNTYTPDIKTIETMDVEKMLLMVFVVDTSGSMSGNRINAVNEAFEKMIPELKTVQEKAAGEYELRISILQFDYSASWLVEPTPIRDYTHEPITANRWQTHFSAAFEELYEKLSRKNFMEFEGKKAVPYIMFLTDGYPEGDDSFQESLDKLMKNGWFNCAQRFAVLIGEDAIESEEARDVVSQFVSNPAEGIINAEDATAIVKEVQARTVHTIANMTLHNPDVESDDQFEGDLEVDDDLVW